MIATPAGDPVPEDRDALVVEHLDLVQHVVNQVSVRYPRHVDRQELWNAGAYGLVDASRRFDPDAGIPFARYAMIRIRGAIIDSTRSRDWATRALRRGMRDVRQATEDLTHTNHREPTPDELATTLGITVDQLTAYRSAAVASTLLHLDQRLGTNTDDDTDTTLADTVIEADTQALPDQALEQQELVGTLRAAVTHLPDIQRTVITRYYFNGDYLRDIADDLGVTEARISQIRSEALTAIRAYFATQFDGIPWTDTDDHAPGRRARASFLTDMAQHTTWRTRLDQDAPSKVVSA